MGFICSAGSAGNNKAPVQNEMGNWWLCWGFPVCQKWLLGTAIPGGDFSPSPRSLGAWGCSSVTHQRYV